eukprot:2903480-Prymnesium_polylepis.1
MYGAAVGTLRVRTGEGATVWSKSGNVGSSSWFSASTTVSSGSFLFEAEHHASGSPTYQGDIAVDDVT